MWPEGLKAPQRGEAAPSTGMEAGPPCPGSRKPQAPPGEGWGPAAASPALRAVGRSKACQAEGHSGADRQAGSSQLTNVDLGALDR